MPALPRSNRSSSGIARPLGVPRMLAPLVPVAVVLLLGSALPHGRTLPACDAPTVLERLADAIEEIPALSGRHARLIDLADPHVRGFAGRRPLRACQARLVTSAGTGALEYSIRRTPDGALAVRPELFQGGWRHEFLPTDSS